jgi:hypothetical protein
MKKSNPFAENGEPAVPKKKVLSSNPTNMKRTAGKDLLPMAKPKVPPMKGGKKMCPACLSAKKSSCSHQ